MGEWKRVKLGEVCTLVPGFAFKSGLFGEFPSKVIKITNIEDGISEATLSGVDVSGFAEGKLDKYLVTKGDYVVAMTGSIGKIGRVIEGKAYINQRVLTIRAMGLADKSFIYYLIRSRNFLNYMLTHVDSHSVQPNISAGTIGEYEFDLPDLPTQRRIAAVLGALDDKIEVNRKICENLEAQAQALFKAWFVDFEPFGGKRPEGWKMCKLGDVAAYYDGKIDAAKLSPATYFSTENMLANREGAVDAETVPQSGMVPLCDEGCVLVSNIRPYFKKIIRVNCDGGHSPDVLCFKAKALEWQWYLYRMLWDDAFFAYVMSSTKGTKMPRGDKGHIMDYPCVLPLADDIRQFNDALASLNGRIEVATRESRALAAMRDALLPKLMSGELAVEKVA